MKYTEFSSKIKEKYPDYANLDDEELARKVLEKYPDYKKLNIEFDKKEEAQQSKEPIPVQQTIQPPAQPPSPEKTLSDYWPGIEDVKDTVKGFAKGAVSTVSGLGGAMQAASNAGVKGVGSPSQSNSGNIPTEGKPGLGETINKLAQSVDKKYLELKNDEALLPKITSGFGSAATFLIPGMGVAGTTSKVATVAPRVAAWLGIGTSAVLESAVNAGGVYNEALSRGMTDEEAKSAAGKTFVANLPVNTVLSRLNKLVFSKMPEGKRAVSALKSAGEEAAQEGLQQAIQNIFLHDPVLQGVPESALIGGIVGGGIGSVMYSAETPQDQIQPRQEAPQSSPAELMATEQEIEIPNKETLSISSPTTAPIKSERTRQPKIEISQQVPVVNQGTDTQTTSAQPTTQSVSEDVGGDLNLDSRKWQVDMPTEKSTDKTINKTQIIRQITKDFDIPIRGKATQRWQKATQGTYNTKTDVIRTRTWGELEPLVHEVAHKIDFSRRKKKKEDGKPIGNWLLKETPAQNELRALDYEPNKGRIHEGFAEFMRHYLTTGKAQELAPKFYDYFTKKFLPENPDIAEKVERNRSMLEIWQQQGAEERINQQIDFRGEHEKMPWRDKLTKIKEEAYTQFVDSLYPVQKVTKEVERRIGKELRPSKNPFKIATMLKSKSLATARSFVMDKAVDVNGNIVGPGLREVISPIPKDQMRNFIKYATVRRAKFLHDSRGIETGFDIRDVNYVLNKYQNKAWDEVSDSLTNWSNNLINYLVESGGLSKEAAEIIRNMNPIYLPLKRAFAEELEVRRVGPGGAKMANMGSPIKSIGNSGRAVINPLESLISQASEIISKANRMRVASAIAEVANEQGVGGFIERVPAPLEASRLSLKEIVGALESKGLIKEGTDKAEIPDDVLTFFTESPVYKGKDNIIMIWRNGEREFYEVHPDLKKAMDSIDPIKLGIVLRIMAPATRLLRLGATGLSTTFSLVHNPIRDALGYSATSKSKNANPLQPLKGLWDNYNSQEGDLIWRYKAMGGKMSGQVGFDRISSQALLDEVLNANLGKKGVALKVVKNPIQTLREILSFSELGPRVSELTRRYEQLKKIHPDWTEEDVFIEAYNDAQDVTVNFTRSGSTGRKINEATAFFNASIQGPNKLYRAYKDNPSRIILAGLLLVTLPKLVEWLIFKDEDWYNNLPYEYKYTNYFIKLSNGNIVRIPTPFEIGMIFGSTVLSALDSAVKKSEKPASAMLNVLEKTIPPLIPTVLKPWLEVLENKNFLGQPIETPADRRLYVTERYNENTMYLSRLFSKGLDNVGISLSPKQIDHLIHGYTGGVLKQGGDLSSGEMADLPFFGRLFLRMPERPRRQLNEFYADYEVLSQKKASGIETPEENARLIELKATKRILDSARKIAKKNENDDEIVQMQIQRMADALKQGGYD